MDMEVFKMWLFLDYFTDCCRCLRSNATCSSMALLFCWYYEGITPQEPGQCAYAPEKDPWNCLIKSILNAPLQTTCSAPATSSACLGGSQLHLLHCALDHTGSLWPLQFASFFLAHEYRLEILWSGQKWAGLILLNSDKIQSGSIA